MRKNDDKKIYAMKVLKKKHMIKKNQIEHIRTERKILELIDHPFIIKLKYAFQSPEKLYFVTDYCPGGEIFFHIQRVERFNEEAYFNMSLLLVQDSMQLN